ncbi:MAG: ComEC/Rec2 family competence protein [Treponemataceae bacterium]
MITVTSFLEKKPNIQIFAFLSAVFLTLFFICTNQRKTFFIFLFFCATIFLILFIVKRNRLIFLAFFSLIFIFFVCYRFIKINQPLQTLNQNHAITKIYGTIISNPIMSKNNNYSFWIDVEKTEESRFLSSAKGRVLIFIPAEKQFSRTKTQNFLLEQGGKAIFSVQHIKDNLYKAISINNLEWTNELLYFRGLCRAKLRSITFALGESGGLFLALLSGSRDFLPEAIADAFRKAGLAHILALSGMHVSLFTGLAVFIGKIVQSRKIGLLFSLCAVACFVWFAGLSPSLFRALLCVFISTIFSLLFLQLDLLSLLSFSFILHIAIFPSDSVKVAFLLSYGAILGISCFEPPLTNFLKKISPFPQNIISLITTSISANIFTAPLSLYFFSFFTPIGIIATIFVSPLVSTFFILSFFYTIVSFIFPFSITIFTFVLNVLYFFIKTLVLFFSGIIN